MKALLFAALFLFASAAHAQHSVNLTWNASPDSTASNPGTVTIWRAVGQCPPSGIGTLNYVALTTSAPAGGSFQDATVAGGTQYCYFVTATIGGATSGPGNKVYALVPVAAPQSLRITVN